MNEFTLRPTPSKKKINLTRQFIVTGLFAFIFIVSIATLRGYYSLRSFWISSATNELVEIVDERINAVLINDRDSDVELSLNELKTIARNIEGIQEVNSIVVYALSTKQLWASDNAVKGGLLAQELLAFNRLLAMADQTGTVVNADFTLLKTWQNAPFGKINTLPVLYKVRDLNGTDVAVLKLQHDFSESIDGALFFSLQLFIFTCIASLVFFLMLYLNFRRGVKTIERQELKLNMQISRLSDLLESNKSLQKSMKTASSRAVELNEQFLRRVGADLHDGPAQILGYSVLRLDSISKQEEAKQFSHEFHAVKEALEQSLDEIRGISSGLVLPEIASLSMEECLRKVVTLHSVKSDANIAQYYQNLDVEIPLPIKICAYRFVQEGLNNAHRHGQAKKCRISASIKSDELVISLKDNGMGFRKSTLNHEGDNIGLIGLRDRIESLGGKFSINSELGVGTALKLSLNLVDDN